MHLDKITTAPLESPSDLIDLQESLVSNIRWAFRGQSQSYGTLIPSFQRIFVKKRSHGAAEIIERDLIKTFRKHYAELGDRTAEMPSPNMITDGFDLRCLSVMQHYGVPTRLLDWTSNFWTAVYFACAGDPAKEAELWIYDRDIFTWQKNVKDLALLLQPSGPVPTNIVEPILLPLRDKQQIIELDPQLTPRMRQQFAHHTLSSDVFADHAPLLFSLYPPVEESAPENTNQYIPFRRVLISAGCKEKALRFLEEQKQVNAGTIFPDVEGLGKFLNWHLGSLVTTLL